MGISLILLLILVSGSLPFQARADATVQEKQALLDFIRSVPHSRRLNWNETTSVCNNWVGVTCNHDNSRVIAVRLPGVGLTGSIPYNTLSRLSSLQILSLRSNSLDGPFPSDLLALRNLMALYLESNNFQGPLPSEFHGWQNISVLNLASNHFNGSIPSWISNLTHLTYLDLARNSLSGLVPGISIESLQILDLSNNNLTGVVPKSLLRFPASSFSGNNVSFEVPMSPSPLIAPATFKHSRLSEPIVLGIVIAGFFVAFVVTALLLISLNRKKTGKKRMISGPRDGNTKLAFLDGGAGPEFDLEDLLRASAQVLGKGTFAVAYKAALEDGVVVAVKRLNSDISVSRKDFEQNMGFVGKIRHDNVAPLRAYYYATDEKILVYDYFSHGSVASMLHGNAENRGVLDWETRTRIAIGAARGLAHIHQQCWGTLVHGNIKASNVFLNSQKYGCVSDLGLATLMNFTASKISRFSGYLAPEVRNSKFSQAADVYSFGVFLLELLTGKAPVHTPGPGQTAHLVRWVRSVVHEEWTGEVFDVELLRYPNIEEDMVATLQIALNCVANAPSQRPKFSEVLRMLEDLRSVEQQSLSSVTRSPASAPTPSPARNVGDAGPSSSCDHLATPSPRNVADAGPSGLVSTPVPTPVHSPSRAGDEVSGHDHPVSGA